MRATVSWSPPIVQLFAFKGQNCSKYICNAHQIVSDENGTLVSVTAKGLLHLECSHSQLFQVLGHIAPAAFDIKVSFPRIFVQI